MANWKLGKIQFGFTETASAAGTLTLTSSSKMYQIITGSLAHTVKLPDATTLATGISFVVLSATTGAITVQDNGSNVIGTVAAGTTSEFILTNAGSANGTWRTYSSGSSSAAGIGSKTPGSTISPSIGLIGGGGSSALIEYINLLTLGSANTFANLSVARGAGIAGVGSSTRAIFGGGNTGSVSAVIDYVQFGTSSNAVSFGSLSAARDSNAGCSNSTRGVFGGGLNGSSNIVNTIEYVTIDTLGNTTNFGNLLAVCAGMAGLASTTRGVFAGGNTTNSGPPPSNVIQYITIASTGNSTSFGTLTVARRVLNGCSNATTGLFDGGQDASALSSVIDYITIASTGNATSFGNLTTARRGVGSMASPVRAVFAGGDAPSAVIDYVTIATTANAVSFGNLQVARGAAGACSNCHGGI